MTSLHKRTLSDVRIESATIRTPGRLASDQVTGPCTDLGEIVISIFTSPVTFGGSVWVLARAASSKGTVSLVPESEES